jgi:hypothetical protein
MTKKCIKEFKSLELYVFEGTLQNMQNKIKELIDEGWVDIELSYDYECQGYNLSKLRLETDEEYTARIKFENKQKEKQEKRERETYLKLKKKFEPS